jgi:protoheme IX farnesyltransferase
MKDYYRLIKPGIVYGNVLTALAAFVFATHRHFTAELFVLLLATLLGLALCIASACVINNILDRDIDARMERTSARAIPNGRISVQQALIFATVLFAAGCAVLLLLTNMLTFAVTLFGVLVYVGLYTPLKRCTIHSTIVGAVAGAVPPVVGYVAVTNMLDATALSLFLILVCWQMTHFFAIAIFRLKDYSEAGLPVMPVKLGLFRTKILMALYVVLFAYAALALYLVQNLGILYAGTLSLLSVGWFALSLYGFRTPDINRWAKRMFFYSIIVILLFSFVLAFS